MFMLFQVAVVAGTVMVLITLEIAVPAHLRLM